MAHRYWRTIPSGFDCSFNDVKEWANDFVLFLGGTNYSQFESLPVKVRLLTAMEMSAGMTLLHTPAGNVMVRILIRSE